MEEELEVRRLSHCISSYNVRVAKLTRAQEKIKTKEDNMISLRNALKLYQNYKAMETCCESLINSMETVCSRLNLHGQLFVGRVGEDYLVLERQIDGTITDYFHPSNKANARAVYSQDQVAMFCPIQAPLVEYRTKHPVLALYPGSNRMLPAQVSSPPSRRRKTQDYLVKFPTDPHSVPCAPQFVIDPSDV